MFLILPFNMPDFFNKKIGGFTIIELVVTTGIFVLITTVAMVKNTQFNSSVSITNLAYEVALQIREAQSFGVSVKEFGVGSGNFGVSYGVHFKRDTLDSFDFFADVNGNSDYESGSGSLEWQNTLSMVGGNSIQMFCATPISGAEVCSDDGSITKLNILFERPKPDALINTGTSGYSSARIVIISRTGTTREINVKSTGQIGVVE